MATEAISLPVIADVAANGAAFRAGLRVGDTVHRVNGVVPRDILEWTRLVDDLLLEFEIVRGGLETDVVVERKADEPLGLSIDSAVFDRIHTCDNHCEFCFIYQLPKGMRKSLYLKDDDYRLSFLFGNFTTLTRFTEADFERVLDESLSPLYVSIHAAQPAKRSEMLRNDRGGFSLRWMRLLIEHGIQIKGQIVLCPGVNDGQVLEDTLGRLLEEVPQIHSLAIVPLGVSRFNPEERMRPHTTEEAQQVVAMATKWMERWRKCTGREVVRLADELYLVAGIDVPSADHYDNYPMLEDGVGLVRSFVEDFAHGAAPRHRIEGFFQAVDGRPHDYVRAINPAADTALRPVRSSADDVPVISSSDVVSQSVSLRPRPASPAARGTMASQSLSGHVGVLTGRYGALVIEPLLKQHGFGDVSVHVVENTYFGGNTAVAGLMTAHDLRLTLEQLPTDGTYLLPDVCLNNGRFLDGETLQDLSSLRTLRVISTHGGALRAELQSLVGSQS